MKKFIKINFIILVIFSIISSSFIFCSATSEETPAEETQTEEESGEKTMDDLELEKANIQVNIDDYNNQIQIIEDEISSTVAEIAEINQKVNDLQLQIETLIAQEEVMIVYINQAEKELEASTEKYKKLEALLDKRLVAMYEMGNTSYLDLLFNSRGITDFLSNYYLIQEVTAADQELLASAKAEKKYNKALKETLDKKKSELERSREEVEKNTIALENMNIIKSNRMAQLNEEELEMEAQIEEYQTQIANIEKEIRLLALANISAEYVGGTMAWPVPGYTRITSPFGMRTHPITGVYKLHTGTDIGAPYGASFIAANDGIVTYAGFNRAYGNMVIIDHGGGISTLYAHGSEILVQVGQTVMQGTPVLKVGSTGYSTGPHAHFEVRVNGQYVNPIDYITSYSSNTKSSKNNEIKVELTR